VSAIESEVEAVDRLAFLASLEPLDLPDFVRAVGSLFTREPVASSRRALDDAMPGGL
jgi:hypothetical protein